MCGRYTLTITPEMLRTLINFAVTPNLEPRFNIAPTQMAPVVRADGDGGRKIDMLRWGLIPSWSKDMSVASKLINARGETIAQKPSFRDAYQERRCLIPADGFYEWRKEGDVKQPFRIGFRGGKPFLFAGLWESWTAPDGSDNAGETIETYTIVTTDANAKLSPIHHRMPCRFRSLAHRNAVGGGHCYPCLSRRRHGLLPCLDAGQQRAQRRCGMHCTVEEIGLI